MLSIEVAWDDTPNYFGLISDRQVHYRESATYKVALLYADAWVFAGGDEPLFGGDPDFGHGFSELA